jgi:hypothetical protein
VYLLGAPDLEESICNTLTDEESFICQRLRSPETVDFVLYIGNAALLEKLQEDPKKVQAELDIIDEMIFFAKQESITYAVLQRAIQEMSGSLIALAISEQINMFQWNDAVILPADREMILFHLNKQKRLVEIALM